MAKTILAIYDDMTTLCVVRNLLHADGYDVICVSSGREAMDVLADRKVDGVLTDYYIQGFDGDSIVACIYRSNLNIPTVVYAERISANHEAGVQCFGFVRKVLKNPCSEQRLMTAVREAFGVC